jgi:hypothetical protein
LFDVISAIPAAADSVIAKINTDKVAAYFGTRHPGEDAAIGKSFEEQKKLLIDALKRKATALGKFIHADADAKTAFDNTLTELKKWVDVEGADFIEFNTTLELSKKNLGLALKYVRKDIAASPSVRCCLLFHITGWSNLTFFDRLEKVIRKAARVIDGAWVDAYCRVGEASNHYSLPY